MRAARLVPILGLWAISISSPLAHADDAPVANDQAVLGPGIYAFQTRTLSATCADDERTGNVSSFVALVNGVPGSADMSMQLLGSRYWSKWTLKVSADGEIQAESFLNGSSGDNRPVNRVQLQRHGDRFTGQGTRIYSKTISGRRTQCAVTVEALLRRIDLPLDPDPPRRRRGR